MVDERPHRRNSEVLAEAMELEGSRLLDVGCGEGDLLGWFLRRGADAFGLDPQPARLEEAARRIGPGRCVAGRGEMLPFGDAAFDAVVFFNSLHHLPQPMMAGALAEAHRVLREAGLLVVVEPLAEGGYFEVMRPVEDETRVREAALRALRAAARDLFRLEAECEYRTLVPVASPDDLLARLAAADPGRRPRLEALRPVIERRYREHLRRDAKGRPALEQPMRIDLLRRARTSGAGADARVMVENP